MKKLISILLCGALTFTSCSDFLDTDSPSKQSSEVVFETESMAKAALMGIYSSLCGTYAYGQKLSVNWQGVSDIETNPTPDILIKPVTPEPETSGVTGITKLLNGGNCLN